jgi:hypothetical protein
VSHLLDPIRAIDLLTNRYRNSQLELLSSSEHVHMAAALISKMTAGNLDAAEKIVSDAEFASRRSQNPDVRTKDLAIYLPEDQTSLIKKAEKEAGDPTYVISLDGLPPEQMPDAIFSKMDAEKEQLIKVDAQVIDQWMDDPALKGLDKGLEQRKQSQPTLPKAGRF